MQIVPTSENPAASAFSRWLQKYHVLPIAAISLLVIFLWLPFGFKTTGLVEEWGVMAVLRQGVPLFFIEPDNPLGGFALRPLTALPHAISYAIDPNSFVWYNIQQVLYFIAKGVFAYLLLRRLLPNNASLAFLTGVLFVIHPSDTGLFTFRAFHIHCAVALYFIATYLLVVYWDTQKKWVLPFMMVALAASLFMYEVAYLIVLATPVLLLWKAPSFSRRFFKVVALWYVAPMLTLLRTVYVLLTAHTLSYQSSLVAGSQLDFQAMLSAALMAYQRSFIVSWTEAIASLQLPLPQLVLTGCAVVLVFAVSWALSRQSSVSTAKTSRYLTLLLLGLGFIFLGFAPYLPVSSHRFQTFRTYYLPVFGAALCTSIVLYLLLRRNRIYVPITTILIGIAVAHAYQQHSYYVDLSLKQQRLLGEMVEEVPQISESATVVMIDNVGRLGDTWYFLPGYFNAAVSYLYRLDVTSVECVAPTLTANLVTSGEGKCLFDDVGLTVIRSSDGATILQAPYESLIVLENNVDDGVILRHDLSSYTSTPASARYQPDALIGGKPFPDTEWMFSCWPIEGCTPPISSLQETNQVHIEFAPEQVIGTGWRLGEVAPDGQPFSWSVSPISTVYLKLSNNTDYELKFMIYMVVDLKTLDELRLYVNDVPVSISYESTPEGYIFRGVIPAAAVAEVTDEFRFEVNQLVTVPGSAVKLGIAASWLDMQPK